MAPEVASGRQLKEDKGKLGMRADIFPLGVMAFEISSKVTSADSKYRVPFTNEQLYATERPDLDLDHLDNEDLKDFIESTLTWSQKTRPKIETVRKMPFLKLVRKTLSKFLY